MAAKQKAPQASFGQKVVWFTIIVLSFPWSLIYLIVWRGRCVNCGKRIMFNKHVCKKCLANSHAIVDDFDSKMEMFYSQMLAIENIDDIFEQYGYIIDRIDEIIDIYDALDEEVNYVEMKHKVVDYLDEQCGIWFKNQTNQLIKNVAYKNEVVRYLSTEGKEWIEFVPTADDLLEEIQELEEAVLENDEKQIETADLQLSEA